MSKNKRTAYRMYTQLYDRLWSKTRKENPQVRKQFKSQAEFWSRMINEMPHLKGTIDWLILSAEHRFRTHGCVTYFPETTDVAEFLMRTKSRIQDAQALYDENLTAFVIALPSDLSFGVGQFEPNTGIMVDIIRNDAVKEELFAPWMRSLGMDINQHEVRNTSPDSAFNLSISYVAQSDSSSTYTRFTFSSQILVEFLKEPTDKRFTELFEEHGQWDQMIGRIKLTPPERAVQARLALLVCGFLLLAKARPDRIRQGLPHAIRGFQDVGRKYRDVKYMTFTPPERPDNDRAAHYRAGHWRQLVAERYYTGEYKDLTRGSRVVYVTDTFVKGRDVETYTITD